MENSHQIEWYEKRVELLQKDPEERMEVYLAYGQDEKGRRYAGNAYFFCDEFEGVDEIELISEHTDDGRGF